MLGKLISINFSENNISWYESCVAEHHFTVEVADWVSKSANISCDIARGLT